jgi:hypothetical protein
MGTGRQLPLANMGGIRGFAMEMTRRGPIAIKPTPNAGSHISPATMAADPFQRQR